MEKKTIGKLIAALRKANGMTQKELAEKLYVSDKTVSRWECDECTPEISLLPVIAELFGITVDELLRGERRSPDKDTSPSEDHQDRNSNKSDKQLKLMLSKKDRLYKNMTLISVGISILGLLAAAMINLCFYRGTVAFLVGVAFIVVSEICQICFAVNTRISIDEEDDSYTDKIKKANNRFVQTMVRTSFANLAFFAFCLPLIVLIDGTVWGLSFPSWIFWGILSAAILLLIGYILYTLFVQPALCAHRLLQLSEKENELHRYRRRLLQKTLAVSLSIAALLGIVIAILSIASTTVEWESLQFYSCEDFKVYMETSYDNWAASIFDPKEIEAFGFEPGKEYATILNSKGEVICNYYYNPDLYHSIVFNETADDRMPITVVTNEAHWNQMSVSEGIGTIAFLLIGIDLIAAIGIYCLKAKKPSSV